MLPIHTILHPTDFSPRSAHALTLACALARDYDAHLIVLHVATPPAVIYGEGVVVSDADAVFRAERDQLEDLPIPDPALRIERRFEEGDPATEIIHIARDVHADLIVMGSHGRSGLRRLLMGSVAERVMRRAPCPVLTVTSPMARGAETVQASEPYAEAGML